MEARSRRRIEEEGEGRGMEGARVDGLNEEVVVEGEEDCEGVCCVML